MENGVEVGEKVCGVVEFSETPSTEDGSHSAENGEHTVENALTDAKVEDLKDTKLKGSSKAETIPDVPVTDDGIPKENGKVEANGEDVDGYKLDERHETEQSSRTEEITELPDRTEVRVHDVKEVTLEEVLSKERERPVSSAEMEAFLEGDFKDNGEIEIGKDITIEEFTRIELSHEEVIDGKVSNQSSVVKEEHTMEEIEESAKFLRTSPLPGEVQNGETSTEDKKDESDIPPSVDSDIKDVTKEINETEVVVVHTPTELSDDAEKPDTAEIPKAVDDQEVADKTSKSKSLMNYIKAKTRSLSRDRSRNKPDEDMDGKSSSKTAEQLNLEEPKTKKKKVPTATLR